MSESDASWSIWYYPPSEWVGPWVYRGSAEGCTRTLVVGTPLTGYVVFGLWKMRYDPECPGCEGRRP